MAILVDQTKKVIVQGITGREGMARTKLMLDYGTKVVAGCTPGRGGEEVYGVPVFDTVEEAVSKLGEIEISVIFVPAPLVKEAALEALEAGIKLLVLVPDRVPIYDVLEIDAKAKKLGAKFVGPNTLGVMSPGKAVVGMLGGSAKSAREWFLPGNVGVSSRSGGITSSIGYYLSKNGIGISTMIHVGGDAIVGLPHDEVLKLFQEDEETKAVVIFGEIGTSQEERVAELIKRGGFSKPLVAFIGGKSATSGTRFSHAGAIIEGNRGTYQEKVRLLKEAGALVVDHFNDLPYATEMVLK